MSKGGSAACRMSVAAPAVCASATSVDGPAPAAGAAGQAISMVDPLVSPSSWMPASVAVSCAPARCWLARPGFGRPARMECIRTGACCSHASERQQRSTWPPPSSVAPSITSSDACSFMAGRALSLSVSLCRLPGRTGPVSLSVPRRLTRPPICPGWKRNATERPKSAVAASVWASAGGHERFARRAGARALITGVDTGQRISR